MAVRRKTLRGKVDCRTSLRVCGVLAAIALAGAGCGGGGPSRPDVLTGIARDAVETYESLAASAAALEVAVDELCSDPDRPSANAVVGASRALAAVRANWSFSAAVWTGPVMEHRSWAVVDWPPAPDEIADLLTDESKELSVERIGSRVGADQRGLGAAEVLLDWHSRADGGDGIGASSASDAPVPTSDPTRRCDYLHSISAVVVDEAELVLDNWTTSFEGGAPYMETLSAESEMGIDDLVNDSIFLLEAITDLELGRALGETSAEADVEAVVEGPLGLGANDILAHLGGVRTVMIGSRSPADAAQPGLAGLSSLLTDDVAERLVVQLDSADAAVSAIEGPLREAVVNDPVAVSIARAALKELQVTISTEVVSQLGVTIGFSDADGDSSA